VTALAKGLATFGETLADSDDLCERTADRRALSAAPREGYSFQGLPEHRLNLTLRTVRRFIIRN